MTAVVAEHTSASDLWATMPGWGIVVDLTPPELIAARGLRVLRIQLAFGLAIIVLASVGAFVWATMTSRTDEDRLAASQAITTTLTAQSAKYAGVVELQSATSNLATQVTTLMTTDVDVAALVSGLHAVAPAGTTLTSVSVTFAAAAAIPGTTDPTVGTVTLSGTSKRMVDVAAYVTALQRLVGVVNVLPATNSAATAGGTATWSITAQVTAKLYTHRYDKTTATGGH